MQRMQVRPLMASLLALLGLWMALRPLPDAAVSLLIALAGQEDISSSVLMAQFVHFFSNSLIGLSLILWREALSRWLVPQGSGVLVSPRACMAVGTALMGIYFIAAGTVLLGEFLAQQRPNASAYLLGRGGTSVVVGAVLLLSSAGGSRLWALLLKLRSAGWR